MNYKDTLRVLLEVYPSIFTDEAAVLHHLFFVNGNGYHWQNGQLVERGQHGDQETVGEMIKRLRAEWVGDLQHQAVPRSRLYPICKYAMIMQIPDNVQPDWFDAARAALKVAEAMQHTSEDAQYLKDLTSRLACPEAPWNKKEEDEE